MAPLNRELLVRQLFRGDGAEIWTGKENGELILLEDLLRLLLSSSLWSPPYSDPMVLLAVVTFPVKVLPSLEKLARGLGVLNATLGTSLALVSALGKVTVLRLRTRSRGIPITEYLELVDGNVTLGLPSPVSGLQLFSNVLNLVTAVTGMAGKLLPLPRLRLCP